jgi:hypothetical protein
VMNLRDFDPEKLPPHTPVQTVVESAARNRHSRVGMPGDIPHDGTSRHDDLGTSNALT